MSRSPVARPYTLNPPVSVGSVPFRPPSSAPSSPRPTPSEPARYGCSTWATSNPPRKKTFGQDIAQEIADLQAGYHRLQAAGKDAHVWFVGYTGEQIRQRIAQWRALAAHALDVEQRVPQQLRDAYFELVSYPIRGAAMANEYQ